MRILRALCPCVCDGFLFPHHKYVRVCGGILCKWMRKSARIHAHTHTHTPSLALRNSQTQATYNGYIDNSSYTTYIAEQPHHVLSAHTTKMPSKSAWSIRFHGTACNRVIVSRKISRELFAEQVIRTNSISHSFLHGVPWNLLEFGSSVRIPGLFGRIRSKCLYSN